jgi:hypothetical protein
MEFVDRIRAGLGPRYEVADEIGRGGSSVVLRARRVEDGRPVAIKVLNPEVWSGIEPARFAREIRLAAELDHPNVLPLLDSGEVDGLLYYVMPFAEGETLRDRLERDGPLPVAEALALVTSVAEGLGFAHARGVVHRDVKPANILFTGGRVVIADFGVAQAVDHASDSFRTSTGHTPGTPAYMSPEQIGGAGVDARTDVYALGCVLYETLVGEPPFTGRTPQAIVARHLSERPPSVEVVRPTVPGVVANAIERCLAKVPADRFQSMSELIRRLEGAEHAPVRAPTRARSLLRSPLAALAMVAAATGLLLWNAGNDRAMALDDRAVVVFPLVPSSGQDQAAVGWEVALAIGTALEHTEPLRWVDGWMFLPPELRDHPARITPELSSEIAASRGAGHYLWGTIRRTTDSVAVTLRLIAARNHQELRSETAWGAASTPLHQVGLAALLPLLPALLEPGRTVDLSPLTHRTPGAVALTLQGDRAYRESRFAEAYGFYRRAVDEDSLLVIAAARGAASGIWDGSHEDALALARLAVRHSSLLPGRHQAFVRGVEAYLDAQSDTALVHFRSALAEDAGWVEAETLLGETAYHLFRRGADPVADGRAAFERAVAFDSTFTPPLIHLAEIDLRGDEVERARARIARLRRAVGDDEPRVRRLELMADCVEGGEGWNPERWAATAAESPGTVLDAGQALAVGGEQPACAEGAFRALRGVGSRWRWISLLSLQSLLLAQGRVDEVVALLDDALAAGERGQAYNLFMFDALLSARFHGGAEEAAAAARRGLGERYERGTNPQNLWLLSVWHALSGEAELVDALEERLATLRDTEGGREPTLLARAARAHATWAGGSRAEALRQLESLEPNAPLWELYWELDEPLGLEKILLARGLLEDGDLEGALREAARFDHPSPVTYLAYLAPSLAIRARAAEALGRRDAARTYRARLERLGWPDGYVPLAPSGPLIARSTRTEESSWPGSSFSSSASSGSGPS